MMNEVREGGRVRALGIVKLFGLPPCRLRSRHPNLFKAFVITDIHTSLNVFFDHQSAALLIAIKGLMECCFFFFVNIHFGPKDYLKQHCAVFPL